MAALGKQVLGELVPGIHGGVLEPSGAIEESEPEYVVVCEAK
jgi:hypothetical protein